MMHSASGLFVLQWCKLQLPASTLSKHFRGMQCAISTFFNWINDSSSLIEFESLYNLNLPLSTSVSQWCCLVESRAWPNTAGEYFIAKRCCRQWCQASHLKVRRGFLKLPMELILPPSRILGFGKRANSSSIKSLLIPTQSAHTACFWTFRIHWEETGATGFDFKLEIIGLQIPNSTWRRMMSSSKPNCIVMLSRPNLKYNPPSAQTTYYTRILMDVSVVSTNLLTNSELFVVFDTYFFLHLCTAEATSISCPSVSPLVPSHVANETEKSSVYHLLTAALHHW